MTTRATSAWRSRPAASNVGTIHQVSTATGTLSQNVQQTAEVAAKVARNISGVSRAASDGAEGAALPSSSAAGLGKLAANLELPVAKFKAWPRDIASPQARA